MRVVTFAQSFIQCPLWHSLSQKLSQKIIGNQNRNTAISYSRSTSLSNFQSTTTSIITLKSRNCRNQKAKNKGFDDRNKDIERYKRIPNSIDIIFGSDDTRQSAC